MRRHASLLALFLFLALPVAAGAEPISGIAAVVNDEVITTYDVNRHYALLLKEAEKKAPLGDEARAALRTTALDQLIDKTLVGQKIRELNVKVSEEEVRQSIEDVKKQNNLTQEALEAALRTQGLTFDQYKEQLREQLERLRLMSQEVRAKIQVGEKEIRDYYETNRARFAEEDRFHARHIFFRVKNDAPPEEVKKVMATAFTVLQEARTGKDFAALAKQYSDDPAAANDGGELGTFRKGEMLPEIEGAVLVLKPGEVSDIVTTPAGLHIIKLEERIAGKQKTFDEVKSDIEDLLYKQKSEERFTQWITDLKKGAAIEIKSGSGIGGQVKGKTAEPGPKP
ncbi:MAG TPA: peptidylprolyl isomerase [Geobacteraceae bacterium]